MPFGQAIKNRGIRLISLPLGGFQPAKLQKIIQYFDLQGIINDFCGIILAKRTQNTVNQRFINVLN